MNAYSGQEACALLRDHPDIAVILLDVVMESEKSGLEVVRYLRDELKNRVTRIILRTGQPGSAPENSVITEYDINDYKEKSELTKQKLYTSVTAALRSFQHIKAIEKSRHELHRIIMAGANIFQIQSIKYFCQAVLQQFQYLLNIDNPAIHLQTKGFVANCSGDEEFSIIASTGRLSETVDVFGDPSVPEELIPLVRTVVRERKSMFIEGWYISFFETQTRVKNVICIENLNTIDPMTLDLIELFTMDVGIALNNLYLNKEVQDTQIELIYSLGEIIESRSKETSNHVRRVSEYSSMLAQKMKFPYDLVEEIRISSILHDIGKLGIPDSVLLKPGALTGEEREIIEKHPLIGHEILKASQRAIFRQAADIALYHHERWDGTGYPAGLSGQNIPIFARIVSIVDVYDALTSNRVYRPAWPADKAIEYIRNEAGKSFDPDIAALFIESGKEITAIEEWTDSPGANS